MASNKLWKSPTEKSLIKGKEGEVILETKHGSFEIYHGNYGREGIYFKDTKRWCYLSDLLNLEAENKELKKLKKCTLTPEHGIFIRIWTGQKYQNVRFDKISATVEHLKSKLTKYEECLGCYLADLIGESFRVDRLINSYSANTGTGKHIGDGLKAQKQTIEQKISTLRQILTEDETDD